MELLNVFDISETKSQFQTSRLKSQSSRARQTGEMKFGMGSANSASCPADPFQSEYLSDLSSPAEANRVSIKPLIPALLCTQSHCDFGEPRASPSLIYSPSHTGWEFTDSCPVRGPPLFRNAVFHGCNVFEVLSVSEMALWGGSMAAVLISRNVTSLGKNSGQSMHLKVVAFKGDFHLREIVPNASRSDRYPFHRD
jgi:hypothetical protein